MSDPLFTERARSYLLMYPDAHTRLGISKRDMEEYATGVSTTNNKTLRQKVIRRGLTTPKRQIYVGAYRRRQQNLQFLIDNETNPTAKERFQTQKDQETKAFNKGKWQPNLKKENAKVNSRVPYQDTNAGQEYDTVIISGNTL